MSYQAGYVEGEFSDSSRKDWTDTQSRPVKWSCWYPASIDSSTTEHKFGGDVDQPLFVGGLVSSGAVLSNAQNEWPLVVLSHGTGGSATGLSWLAIRLAQSGSICVGVDHHGNTASESYRAEGFICWWERATDLSFVIDQVDRISPISNRVKHSEVSVVGFSLGGYTALALVGAITSVQQFTDWLALDPNSSGGPREFPNLDKEIPRLFSSSSRFRQSWERHGDSFLDTRISKCVAIAPAPTVRGFVTQSLNSINRPTLIIAGEADVEAPFHSCAQWLSFQNSSFHLESIGKYVGHYVFLPECTDYGMCVEREICVDDPRIVRSKIHADAAMSIHRFLAAE